MPPNIFANTGTNVSVIFIDKSNIENDVILIDVSLLGEKIKDGDNQKTILHSFEVEKIENTFINKLIIDDFSVHVSYDEIKDKNYSLSAPQYFDVKLEYVEIDSIEFNKKLSKSISQIDYLFDKNKSLENSIKSKLGELKYEKM